MSRVVLKYPLEDRAVTLDLPIGSTVLTFASQRGVPTLWVKSPAYPSGTQSRSFVAVGTGRAVPSKGRYVGSMVDGDAVWHLYETT